MQSLAAAPALRDTYAITLWQFQACGLEEAHLATILLWPCGCDALDFPCDAAQHALLESPAEQDCMPELPPGLCLLSGLVPAQPRMPQRAVARYLI